MNFRYVKTILYGFSICLIFLSCEKKEPQNFDEYSVQEEQQFFKQALSLDTLSVPERQAFVAKEIQKFQKRISCMRAIIFFKGKSAYYSQQKDSTIFYLNKINADSKEMKYLKDFYLLTIAVYSDAIADSKFMENLFSVTKQAEKDKSTFNYKFYDIIAHSYLNNKNPKKAYQNYIKTEAKTISHEGNGRKS